MHSPAAHPAKAAGLQLQSVAVMVGYIALFGIAVETGVVHGSYTSMKRSIGGSRAENR